MVALHLFTFLLLFMQIVLWPANWLVNTAGVTAPEWLATPLVTIVGVTVAGYMARACAVAYRGGWVAGLVGLVAVLLGMWVANLWVYRALQFLITLWLI